MTRNEKILLVGSLVGFVALKIIRYSKPRIFYVKETPSGNLNAQTIPPFGIFIREDQRGNKVLLEHELIHWQQYRRYGLLGYYLRYGYYHARDSYDRNPMEVEARIVEDEECRENYTDCVRSGKSRTVYNPQFRKK